jgi:hypothetical protein
MYDSNQTTIYNPATGLINNFAGILVLTPDEAGEERFAIVGKQARHQEELTVIFRTTDQATADMQAEQLAQGGLWMQHGQSFRRAAIV